MYIHILYRDKVGEGGAPPGSVKWREKRKKKIYYVGMEKSGDKIQDFMEFVHIAVNDLLSIVMCTYKLH